MASRSIRNVHQRRFAADPEAVGALIDQLGGPDDRVWPSTRWPAIHVSRPITVGDAAGHADVRYFVDEYVPGEALWFRFDPKSGLEGRHGVVAERLDDGIVSFSHILEGHAVGKGKVAWPLMIRAMHDQLLEELLDNAEQLFPGAVRPIPAAERTHLNGRSRWALVLRKGFIGMERLRSVPRPLAAAVAAGGLSGAALLHASWATGANWPGADRIDLARKVVGTDMFPSNASTWVIVGLLTSATAIVGLAVMPLKRSRLTRIVSLGLGAIGGVLAFRAIAGFVVSGIALLTGRNTVFAPRDLLIYSPLCAILAASTAAVAVQRSPNPAT